MFISKFFNNLSYIVNREIKECFSNNEVFQEFQFGIFRRLQISFSEYKRALPTALFLFFLCLSICPFFFTLTWLPKYNYQLNSAEIITYFSALWAIQATITALVYPIIIAYVSFLLQKEHSTKSLLYIYLHDSSAIPSGFSSLLLITLMGIEYLILTVVQTNVGIAWLSINGAWFLINLILTSWFIFRTFKFAVPAERAEVVERFVINRIWPRDLFKNLTKKIYDNSHEYDLLPEPVKDNYPKNKTPTVGTGTAIFDYDEKKPIVELNFYSPHEIIDVRYRLLSTVTKFWLLKVRFKKASDDKAPNLSYPTPPFIPTSEKIVLASISGKISISRLESFLIKRSFKISRKQNNEITTAQVFDDLKSKAISEIKNGNIQEFKETVNNFINVYCSITKASEVTNDGINNLTLVEDRKRFFSPHIFEEWLLKIHELIEKSSEEIHKETEYFYNLIYKPYHLFLRLQNCHDTILVQALELNQSLFNKLEKWWVFSIENQGHIPHTNCTSLTLKPPLQNNYKRLLKAFVGAWEKYKKRLFLSEDENISWDKYSQSVSFPIFRTTQK